MISVAAVAVNADGKRSALGPAVSVTVADRQARVELDRSPPHRGGQVEVSWSPHLLDLDVKTAHVCARPGEPSELAAFG